MSQNQLKVVVIEDEVMTQNLLRLVIQKFGHEVVAIYNNYEDAVQYITSKIVDVIISDIRIQGMDGVRGAEMLREALNTPIVFYSGMQSDVLLEKIEQMGNTAFVSKTANPEELREAIEEVTASFFVKHLKHH